VDIPVIFVAEEKENAAKSANNPLAVVLGGREYYKADSADTHFQCG